MNRSLDIHYGENANQNKVKCENNTMVHLSKVYNNDPQKVKNFSILSSMLENFKLLYTTI